MKQITRSAVLCLSLIPFLLVQADPGAPRPNILLIVADDLGCGDVGALCSEGKIKTPNIDRLAANGTVYTDAHASSSVSEVSRYGILTGRYGWREEVEEGDLEGFALLPIGPERVTIASILKDQGYNTSFVGVWNLGSSPDDAGFDESYGPNRSLSDVSQAFRKGDGSTGGGPVDNEKVLGALTEEALKNIRRHSRSEEDEPWFLYFSPPAPGELPSPATDVQGTSEVGRYGDAIVELDRSVGALLGLLDETSMAQNTLIVFTSDNGSAQQKAVMDRQYGHRPNRTWKGRKTDLWEGGHRVPFMVQWPGKVEEGGICRVTICHTDLLRTLAEAAGLSVRGSEQAEDSFDVGETFGNPSMMGPVRDAVIHHGSRGEYAIRKGTWKLIESQGSGGESYKGRDSDLPYQLYDLAVDAREKDNAFKRNVPMGQHLMLELRKRKLDGQSSKDPSMWALPLEFSE